MVNYSIFSFLYMPLFCLQWGLYVNIKAKEKKESGLVFFLIPSYYRKVPRRNN